MQRRALVSGLAALPLASVLPAEASGPADRFHAVADKALDAMRAKATSLNIGGAAVVAFFAGDTIDGWTSKMIVVGRYKDDPSDKDKGSNLIGIAYAKAAEMADTHQDSGSHLRPPMTGEFGWVGGAIARCGAGYAIAAFSGGKDVDDLAVSHAGLDVLKQLAS
jgi:hypothetical protein